MRHRLIPVAVLMLIALVLAMGTAAGCTGGNATDNNAADNIAADGTQTAPGDNAPGDNAAGTEPGSGDPEDGGDAPPDSISKDRIDELIVLLTQVAARMNKGGGGTSGGGGGDITSEEAATEETPRFHDQLLMPVNDQMRWLDEKTKAEDLSWGLIVIAGFIPLFGGFILGYLLIFVIHPFLARMAKYTKNERDDELIDAIKGPLEKLVQILGVVLALYVWTWRLHYGDTGDVVYKLLVYALFVSFWVIIGMFLWRFVEFVVGVLEDVAAKTETTFDNHLIQPVRNSLRAAVVIFVAIMVIETVGGSVAGILAGLGLGGLAFALAGQETIKNLFGSITVFGNRPFRIGDSISVGDVTGTVESIGFWSTRIRTWDKTEVTLPNKAFTDGRVENITRRTVRRFTATFGATYDTTRKQMDQLVNAIRARLGEMESVDTNSISVYFTAFGESSLDILVRANINELNYAKYLSTVQDMNFAIWELYDEYGVSMPFPTRTVDLSEHAIEALSSSGAKKPAAKKAAAKKKTAPKKAAASKKAKATRKKKKDAQAAGEALAEAAEKKKPDAGDRTAADLDLTD